MADKSIGDFERASQINDNDLFVLEQNGTAKSLTGKKVKDYVHLDIDAASATTLPAGSRATANYDSVTHKITFGIPVGESAYQSAQDGGYTGTEQQFNSDLAGVGGKIASTEKGTAGGVATLGSDGKVPSSQLPKTISYREV